MELFAVYCQPKVLSLTVTYFKKQKRALTLFLDSIYSITFRQMFPKDCVMCVCFHFIPETP